MLTKSDMASELQTYRETVKRMLDVFRDVPFHMIVQAATNHQVIPLTRNSAATKQLIDDIRLVVNSFAKRHHTAPIDRQSYFAVVGKHPKAFRNNEIGKYVDHAIPAHFRPGMAGVKLISQFERLGGSGYPDSVITDKNGATTFVEIKATTRRNEGSARDFYFTPSETSRRKITADGHHLLLGVDTEEREPGRFFINGWCLVDLHDMRVTIKPEFNADNTGIYLPELIVWDEKF